MNDKAGKSSPLYKDRPYNTFEALREHPEIAKFVKWVRKKPLGYRDRNKTSHQKGRRRRR